MAIAVVTFSHPEGVARNESDLDAMVIEQGQIFLCWSPYTEFIFLYVVQTYCTLRIMRLKKSTGHGDSSCTSASKKGSKLRVLEDV